ncbi:unnamed protein product [Ophioblennius macclurei]
MATEGSRLDSTGSGSAASPGIHDLQIVTSCAVRDSYASLTQRERTVIPAEQKETLKSAFEQGMTSVGSPLIPVAAEVTGLPTAVIENWIGNYKRTLKEPPPPGPTRIKLHTRDLSAYNLFCRDHLRNKGTLKDIKEKWSSLGDEQRTKYLQEAAVLKAEGKTQLLSPERRELKIKRHLKQLKLEVASLEELGVETAIMLFDCQKPNLKVHEVSSKGANAILDSMDTVSSFALHYKACSSTTVPAHKEPIDVLIKKVQDVFNKKYKEAGGDGRLPYQSVLNQSIMVNVSGLPDGLVLKKPSYYGRKQLEEILKAAEHISFQIGGQSGSEQPIKVHQPIVAVKTEPMEEEEAEEEEDDKKNILKEWHEWRQCKSCKLWSLMPCVAGKSSCIHCQNQTP